MSEIVFGPKFIEIKTRPIEFQELRREGCTCGDSIAEHSCPYKEEIEGDYKTLCRCCPVCEHECAMDI